MEISSIAGQAIQQALNKASATPAAGIPGKEASPDAVAALQNALNSQPDPRQNPASAQPDAMPDAQRVEPVQPTADGAGASLGDRILNGLGQLNDSTRDAVAKVDAAVGPTGDISPAELIKAQYALMQVSLQQDVTAKAAGKATQTLDTLLKNQ